MKAKTSPTRWKITRTIVETYDGYGETKQEAIGWLNRNSGGAGSVKIIKETAVKVKDS